MHKEGLSVPPGFICVVGICLYNLVTEPVRGVRNVDGTVWSVTLASIPSQLAS